MTSESPDTGRSRGCLFEIVETAALTLVIFLGVQAFVAQPYKVEGTSMERTLEPDVYLLIDKLTPRWAPYHHGEIVVFQPPNGLGGPTGTPSIKRVIGLAGDQIELRDGQVFVNGVALAEPYVFADGRTPSTDPAADGSTEWLVPDEDLFVLGDHRAVSEDSRAFGPIPISNVIGRAFLRSWPLDEFGLQPAATYPTSAP